MVASTVLHFHGVAARRERVMKRLSSYKLITSLKDPHLKKIRNGSKEQASTATQSDQGDLSAKRLSVRLRV